MEEGTSRGEVEQSVTGSTAGRDLNQFSGIRGDVYYGTGPPAQRRQSRTVLIAALAIVVVAAGAFAFTERGRRLISGRSGPEVTFAPVDDLCGQGWVVRDDGDTQPDPDRADARFRTWLEEHGAVRAKASETLVTLTGSSSYPLVIEDIKVIVTERRAPLSGRYVYSRCGGPSPDKHFAMVDLDDLPVGEPVSLRARAASTRIVKTRTQALGEVNLVQFPFVVTRADYTYVDIIAHAKTCDCSWKAEVVWLNGDKRGVERSADTFRLSGIAAG